MPMLMDTSGKLVLQTGTTLQTCLVQEGFSLKQIGDFDSSPGMGNGAAGAEY